MNNCPNCDRSMEGETWYAEPGSNRAVCLHCSRTLTIAQLSGYASEDNIEAGSYSEVEAAIKAGVDLRGNIGVDLIRIKQDIREIKEHLATIEHEIKSEKKEVLPSETVS